MSVLLADGTYFPTHDPLGPYAEFRHVPFSCSKATRLPRAFAQTSFFSLPFVQSNYWAFKAKKD